VNKTICRMGENYAFIKPNGDVERCCKNHSMNLGNIINGTFKLLDKSQECTTEDCYCWRRMIVGTDNKWSMYWKSTWDQFYCDRIRNIIGQLNNKNISFNEACEKYIVLKQKICNMSLRKSELDVLENNILSNKLNIAWNFLENNEIKNAEKIGNELLSVYDIFNPVHKVNILKYLITISIKLNNLEMADKYFIEAKKMCVESGNEETLNNIGQYYISIKIDNGYSKINTHDFVCAQKLGEELFDIYKILNLNSKKSVLIYLSRLNIVLGKLLKAKEYVIQIKDLDSSYPAMYKLLGIIEFNLSNYVESKNAFRKAFKYAKKNGDKNEFVEICREIVIHIKRWYNIKVDIDKQKSMNIINKIQKIIERIK